LLALGVGEKANSGEKIRFSMKDIGEDVWSHDRTYNLSCHGGRTNPSWTYDQSVIGKPYFHQPSLSSCFLVIELCFSRNRTDDRSFLGIRGYGASRELYGGAL
jgi:hypothetical protein